MADTEKAKQDRIEKLIAGLEERHTKTGELLAELRGALEAKLTTGQIANTLVKEFAEEWANAHGGETYVPAWQKDVPAMKRILVALGDVDEVRRRRARYLKSTDPFYVNARHPLSMFCAAVNKFGTTPARASGDDDEAFLTAPVSDCRHRPPCRSDQEHTKRRRDDLRSTGRP